MSNPTTHINPRSGATRRRSRGSGLAGAGATLLVAASLALPATAHAVPPDDNPDYTKVISGNSVGVKTGNIGIAPNVNKYKLTLITAGGGGGGGGGGSTVLTNTNGGGGGGGASGVLVECTVDRGTGPHDIEALVYSIGAPGQGGTGGTNGLYRGAEGGDGGTGGGITVKKQGALLNLDNAPAQGALLNLANAPAQGGWGARGGGAGTNSSNGTSIEDPTNAAGGLRQVPPPAVNVSLCQPLQALVKQAVLGTSGGGGDEFPAVGEQGGNGGVTPTDQNNQCNAEGLASGAGGKGGAGGHDGGDGAAGQTGGTGCLIYEALDINPD